MLATLGSRAFSSVAPVLWNNLPADIRNVNTQSLFKIKLKTFLFRRAFSEAWGRYLFGFNVIYCISVTGFY